MPAQQILAEVAAALLSLTLLALVELVLEVRRQRARERLRRLNSILEAFPLKQQE